jgi:hypothetical protein
MGHDAEITDRFSTISIQVLKEIAVLTRYPHFILWQYRDATSQRLARAMDMQCIQMQMF